MQIDACGLTKRQAPDDSLDEVIDGTTDQVQHPLLDRVKQCSTNPRQAALFFQQILNPDPHVRVWALYSPWLKEVVDRMFEDTRTSWESGFEADENWRDKLSFFKKRFSCYRQPSVEEQLSRNQYPDRSSKTEKRRHAALDRKLCKLHDAAVAIQEGTAKQQTTIKGHCKKAWTKLRCAVPGNRKRDRMCTQPFAANSNHRPSVTVTKSRVALVNAPQPHRSVRIKASGCSSSRSAVAAVSASHTVQPGLREAEVATSMPAAQYSSGAPRQALLHPAALDAGAAFDAEVHPPAQHELTIDGLQTLPSLPPK